jgi:hypothetical protein
MPGDEPFSRATVHKDRLPAAKEIFSLLQGDETDSGEFLQGQEPLPELTLEEPPDQGKISGGTKDRTQQDDKNNFAKKLF